LIKKMIKLTKPQCPNPVALQTNYKHKDNKEALRNACFDKCMYCESKITHIEYGDVEHIKPKSIFPELKFDWDNLGYACTKCNRDHKKEKHDDDFINPFVDDPEIFLQAIGGIIFSRNGRQRGEITIILGQNWTRG